MLEDLDPRLRHFAARFGEEVKRQREKRGLTQKELAEWVRSLGVEVSQGYISLIESGSRIEPRLGVVTALSLSLSISLDSLLGEAHQSEVK